ncbi:MAG: prepilin-type N-terminal cleavage/methylation domain-containing protein [Bacilli bacterium]
MKNKGFTLVELLAVIVVLAVIAVISTPIILGVIETAKQGAAKSSVLGYVDTIEKYAMVSQLDSSKDLINGTYLVEEMNNLVSLKGEAPTSGVVVVNESGEVTLASVCINNYKVDYTFSNASIDSLNTCDEIDTNLSTIGYSIQKKVNAPVLATGMTPIKWVDGVETVTTEEDLEWYDYDNKLWANAKTADGSYWVWIPRYAYKITSGYHSSDAGSIDVKFLVGTSDIAVDGTNLLSSGYIAGTIDTSTNYFVHPVFQNDLNELGFWVAKFESTALEGVENEYITNWSCPIEGDNVSTKTIQSLPNATSWRCINISTAYKAALAMKKNTVYGWEESSVDTHMETNLELGAIYYLTLSDYGANTNEVYINNNQNYITGCAGSTASAGTSTSATCTNPYNSSNGVRASTTWNITGVYDMSGGSSEKIMAVYNNIISSSGFTTNEFNALTDSHITKYTTSSNDMLNNIGMDYDLTVYGDGIYETSKGANQYNGTEWSSRPAGGWNTETSYLPSYYGPWFERGTRFDYSSIAGLGAFSDTYGGANSVSSFRAIVSVIK